MNYQEILRKLKEKDLIADRAIAGAQGLRVISEIPKTLDLIARVETSDRINTFTLDARAGKFFCSCMKKESKKVCKDILAFLEYVMKRKSSLSYALTLIWFDNLIKRGV